MRTGRRWIFWILQVLLVITGASLLAVITDIALFESTPVLYSVSMAAATTGLALVMRNRFRLPVLSSMHVQGSLLISPLLLLALSVPAALIYIVYDLNGNESLKLLSALFISLATIFFIASLLAYSLTSSGTILRFYEKSDTGKRGSDRLTLTVIAATALVFVLLVVVRFIAGLNLEGLVLVVSLFSLLLVILDVLLSVGFRNDIMERISRDESRALIVPDAGSGSAPVKGFRSVLLFPGHYLDLICGKLDYLSGSADESYVSEVVHMAAATFDPALIPALKAIGSRENLSEAIRLEASKVKAIMEKYFSDPVRNSDLLKRPGINEKTTVARSILAGRKAPQPPDIIKLLNDASPEIRRIGLAAAGLYGMKELVNEAVVALFSPDTEKEAYNLLLHFGPEVYGESVLSALKPQNTEGVSMMIIRLLSMMPLSNQVQHLTNFISNGPVTVRLGVIKYLFEQGFVPGTSYRQPVEEAVNETVYTIARLISLQLVAVKNRHFILSGALEWERSLNYELLFSLLNLLAGSRVTGMIRSYSGGNTVYDAGIAAELIDAALPGPVRRPLLALFGRQSDKTRLADLSLNYPLREVSPDSLANLILSADQNITGIWTKACALHKVARDGKGAKKEIVLSYLFSNSQLLQEEAAMVLRTVNHSWFSEAEPRLTEQVRTRIAAVVNGTTPEAAMMYAKTRFLSLCFRGIPEERMIMMASGLRYSESYDAGSLPGLVSWIVPSKDGKSGLYSLPVNDITSFVFHYSEYTDIFVDYMDKQVSEPSKM